MVKKETANSKLAKTINEATNSHLSDESIARAVGRDIGDARLANYQAGDDFSVIGTDLNQNPDTCKQPTLYVQAWGNFIWWVD